MSSKRVFELAKELKIPAREVLNKLKSIGITATGNFHELSHEQVSKLQNVINGRSYKSCFRKG
jgi:hypothetical protein